MANSSAEIVFGPFDLEEMGQPSDGDRRWAEVHFFCHGKKRNALMATIHVPAAVARSLELFGSYEIVLRTAAKSDSQS
jgi:hypothetical protein